MEEAEILISFYGPNARGYATLLLSANGGIVAFGLAALLGELSCVLMAVLVAPALFAMLRRRS